MLFGRLSYLWHSNLLEIYTQMQVEIEMEEEKRAIQDKMVTMTDVDPKYFTELSGKSVKEEFSLSQYVQDIREILETKLLIGQEKDNYIHINEQFEQGLHQLRKIEVQSSIRSLSRCLAVCATSAIYKIYFLILKNNLSV